MSASFTPLLAHAFYARHRNKRDHAKMDPDGWHNHESGQIGAGGLPSTVRWEGVNC